jgi:hypothetical protein
MPARVAKLEPWLEELYDLLASEQLKAELASSVRNEGCQTPTKTSRKTGTTKKRKAAAKRQLLKALDRDFYEIARNLRSQTPPSGAIPAAIVLLTLTK